MLVHEYVATDLDKLVAAVERAGVDYPDFVRQVAAFARSERSSHFHDQLDLPVSIAEAVDADRDADRADRL